MNGIYLVIMVLCSLLPLVSLGLTTTSKHGGSKRDHRKAVTNIIANMTMHPIGMNKTELWQGINRAPNNQKSAYLFDTCVELKIMVKKMTKKGTVNYELHPNSFGPLAIAPRPRKFQEKQYRHLTCDNVLLATEEEREAEHCAQMSLGVLQGKRKRNDNP